MALLDIFRNYINYITGHNRDWDDALASRDISTALEMMEDRSSEATDAYNEYEVARHRIMLRRDKEKRDMSGNFTGVETVWKLPVSYQEFINEMSLVFLYGRPIKWTQDSEGTDQAFGKFLQVIRDTHFDAKIRQCKRIAGSETESAMLFRTYKDPGDREPKVQIRVLSHSRGDEIYTRWDQYDNLIAFAWGYYAKEGRDDTVYHLDLYTAEKIYHCRKLSLGWDVEEEANLIQKIPVIYFKQKKEWHSVEYLIERMEQIISKNADTNDYFADPIAIMDADLIKNMPKKGDIGKLLVIKNNTEGVQNVAKYLTWDSAPESKKQEMDWLDQQIMQKSFTPNLTTETLKSISQLSAKALRTVMLLADIKASRHKEVHDELMGRVSSLVTTIIANVLDVSLAGECSKLEINHEFQEPFGEDIAEVIDNITKSVDGGILSTEGGIELNPLVKNAQVEMKRLQDESDKRQQAQEAIFGSATDASGAGEETGTGDEDADEG